MVAVVPLLCTPVQMKNASRSPSGQDTLGKYKVIIVSHCYEHLVIPLVWFSWSLSYEDLVIDKVWCSWSL